MPIDDPLCQYETILGDSINLKTDFQEKKRDPFFFTFFQSLSTSLLKEVGLKFATVPFTFAAKEIEKCKCPILERAGIVKG